MCMESRFWPCFPENGLHQISISFIDAVLWIVSLSLVQGQLDKLWVEVSSMTFLYVSTKKFVGCKIKEFFVGL
jgi:hypothetical protein